MHRNNPLDDDTFFELLYGQARMRLATAIRSLNEHERMVITLYHYEEFNLDQIATILGISRTRASELYTCGTLNLRARLGDPVGKWKPSVHTSARPPTKNSAFLKKPVRPPEHE